MIAPLVIAALFSVLTLLVLRGLGWVRGTRALAAFALVALVAEMGWLSLGSFVAAHNAMESALRGVAVGWTVACILVVLLGTFALVAARVARSVRRASRVEPAIPGRRRFFAALVPAVAAASSARGTTGGYAPFVVRQETVVIPGLAPALDGFKIGQTTDVHVGPFISVDDLQDAVRTLDDAGVDLQVMTGDLIDDLAELEPALTALAATKARHGMRAVLGNHDVWRGKNAVKRAFAARTSARFALLDDADELLVHDGAPLRIVGVGWPSRSEARRRLQPDERAEVMRASADVGFAHVQPGETVLCLSHHPDFFPYAAERGAHLTLSGHTHGGQVAIFGQPVFTFAYDHMLGRFERGSSHLYVAAGTGHWIPFRFGVPREVTVLTLRAAP